MPSLRGTCLCGSVRYSSDAQPKMTAICHCRHCQKAGGGGYSAIVAVQTDSIMLEGVPRSYATVGTSGQPVTRRFCSDCGSPLFTEAAAFAGLSFIKGGSLDDPSWLEPTLHIWCDSAQPWDTIPDHASRVRRTRGDTWRLCRLRPTAAVSPSGDRCLRNGRTQRFETAFKGAGALTSSSTHRAVSGRTCWYLSCTG